MADNRVQLHLQAVLDKLRQLIAIPGMSLGIGKVAHRLLRTGDERRIQLVTVRHRLEALHHIADLVRIRNHDLIGRLLAQIGEFLKHFLRRMQIQRRLHIRVLIFLAGLQNRTQLCILRIQEMHVAGRHDELAQLFAQLINLAVMRTQILLGTHILAHEEGVVACRLNLQIIIEAGDFLQMRVAHAVAHSAVQLACFAGRADNQALAVFLDDRTRQQRTLVEIAQMADADELIEVTQTCFVLRQKDDMVAGDFRRPCLFNRIKRLRIEVLALEVAVGNQIALHTENQL